MDEFLWWSGIAFWLIFGCVGFMHLADLTMDLCVGWFWTKKEFIAFVANRLKPHS